MKIEKIHYTKETGFISRGEKPANYKFSQITMAIVEGFSRLIKEKINPAGGIVSAEFVDYRPDSDELLLSARWSYCGLSQMDEDRANNLFQVLLESMMARADDLNFMTVTPGQ